MFSKISSKGALGIWTLTALVAGNMIGSGIFLLPSLLAAYGSIGLVSWIITASGAILLALVFAKLSSLIPKTGGPYAYCREAFGDFIGFQIAYNYWIAMWIGNAALAVAFVGYLSVFLPTLTTNLVLSFFVKAGTVWILTVVNILGVRRAGVLQLVTTVLKLIPLILITVFGLFAIHPHNFSQFNISGQSNFAAITGAATLTLWSFIGLESATIPAENVDDIRNIKRATILGMIITASIYILSTVTVMGLIAPKYLANSNAPYADAAEVLFGHVGGLLIAAGAVISCFGTLNGWILLQSQIPLAAARDGLFPQRFAKKSKRYDTPAFALVVSSILITGLLFLTIQSSLLKQFNMIILLATLATLVPYFFTVMAELIIFMKYREQLKGQRLVGSVVIAILAGIYSFWAIAGSGKDVVFYGSLLLFSSLPVYVWMRWSHLSHT